MSNSIQKWFSSTEMFRRLRPDLFLTWLKQSEGYFTKHGLIIPADCSGFERNAFQPGFDYDGLVRIFMERTADIPPELVEGLHMIHEMGAPGRYDKMKAEVQRAGLDLELGPRATSLDVALFLLLRHPRGLQDLHARIEVMRRRKFVYFLAESCPLPAFTEVKLAQQRELEARLSDFYAAWGRGPAVKVSSFCQQRLKHGSPEWLFLVQHAEVHRREEVLEKGVPRPWLFQPWVFSRLKYDPARGEMGVNCSAEHERKILLKIFGRVLFGRENFFPMEAKYDLFPVLRDGRAITACRDVPGIEHVSMTAVEFSDPDSKRRSIHHAPDIFSLVEGREIRWPEKVEHFASATFTVKLWRQKRERRVTIMPSNKALYCRDEESALLELWLRLAD
jgi:hypothetical protein